MKVVASYSIKGGVGKTAASVNLAYGIAAAGMRTLLVDLDAQGSSSFYFRVRASRGLKPAKFFRGRRKLLKHIRGSDYERLDVLPAKLAYRSFDQILDRMKHSRRMLARVVRAFREEYDVVILDAPAGLSLAGTMNGGRRGTLISKRRRVFKLRKISIAGQRSMPSYSAIPTGAGRMKNTTVSST